MDAFFWLILFIVLLIFEAVTLGLFTIWFAGGAFVSFILALFDKPIVLQIIVFFVVSGVLLVLTRPLAFRYLNRSTAKTNIDDIIGKVVKVTGTIDNYNEMGSVRINGTEWTARAIQDGMVIPTDALVQVVEIQGVKALVQPINYTMNN